MTVSYASHLCEVNQCYDPCLREGLGRVQQAVLREADDSVDRCGPILRALQLSC